MVFSERAFCDGWSRSKWRLFVRDICLSVHKVKQSVRSAMVVSFHRIDSFFGVFLVHLEYIHLFALALIQAQQKVPPFYFIFHPNRRWWLLFYRSKNDDVMMMSSRHCRRWRLHTHTHTRYTEEIISMFKFTIYRNFSALLLLLRLWRIHCRKIWESYICIS